ncbi:hypothetical protein K469DRAFT_687454 [Zopfia rhizophila CBS 207.26]|uniref:Uncharacterized protein n=1 Tax=Zopfia rhizophila CBS 207.26 TaxID=1314779 RepID=A0A6A6E4V3_9PEZI|nr:hypothetical protein K469DRAFT_687454 [Zopfia rhizophila CBS 207.26]
MTSRDEAALDLQADGNDEAATELLQHGPIRRGHETQASLSRSDESAPLFPLPAGWRKLEKPGVISKTTFYEEGLTQPIMLTRPKISLIKLRQVKFRFVDRGKGYTCHLDLASCMPPEMGIVNRKLFDKDMATLFPIYDKHLFDIECNTDPSQIDVLVTLREAWKLPTFAMRVLMPQADLLDGLKLIFWDGLSGLQIPFGGLLLSLSSSCL